MIGCCHSLLVISVSHQQFRKINIVRGTTNPVSLLMHLYSYIEFLKNETIWLADRPYDLYICIWIKSSNRALLLLNKKEIYTFAFIPAAQRFHSWNPNKTASMNIVMTCFVCSEAWAGPERNWFTSNVLCSCGNRFNQMFIEFIEYELHICAFSGKLVSWKHSEFEKLKHSGTWFSV